MFKDIIKRTIVGTTSKDNVCPIDNKRLNFCSEMLDNLFLNEFRKLSKTKFLLVEDGSIDVDNVKEDLEKTYNVKIIVYRQGANKPELIDEATFERD